MELDEVIFRAYRCIVSDNPKRLDSFLKKKGEILPFSLNRTDRNPFIHQFASINKHETFIKISSTWILAIF